MTKQSARYLIKSMIMGTVIVHVNAWAGEVITDGTTGPQQTLSGPQYNIDSTLGTVRGGNLFHSFAQFSLVNGDVANFTDSQNANIANVFNRVTGGARSDIDGVIRSSIIGANFYFINPAGIVFGPNAALDVSGSFYASTANNIQFDNGYSYSATEANPIDSTLQVAAVSAFGFIPDAPASITVNNSHLSVAPDKTLALVGGDINLNHASLSVDNGTVYLASRGSQGNIAHDANSMPPPGVASYTGNIGIQDATAIDTSGEAGGHVVIRGGKLLLTNESSVSANSQGVNGDNKPHGIDIVAQEVLLDSGSVLQTNVERGASADSGGIRLTADTINVNNGASLISAAEPYSQGKSGDILLAAKTTSLDNHSFIGTATEGSKAAGDIILKSDYLEILNGSYLYSDADFADATGSAGAITLNTQALKMAGPQTSNSPFEADFTGIYLYTGVGDASRGNVTINTDNLFMTSRSKIETFNSSTGGGCVEIHAQNAVSIIDGSQIFTGSNNVSAGDITISANRFTLAGVNEDVYKVRFRDTVAVSAIQSQVSSPGRSGNIVINADDARVQDGAFIKTNNSFGMGANGSISINAKYVTVEGNNDFRRNLLISQGFNAENAARLSAATISTESVSETTSLAEDGNIHINADTIEIKNGALLSSQILSQGIGGSITLNTGNLVVANGASIASASYGKVTKQAGPAGDITISAKNIDVEGGDFTLLPSGILSNSNAYGGDAGAITITTNTLQIAKSAQINSETAGQGAGGDITVRAGNTITLMDHGKISASASGSGDAGSITLAANTLVLNESGITTTADISRGGDITINVNDLVQTASSVISAVSRQSVSGTVVINTQSELNALTPLPEEIADVADQFKQACGNIDGLETSSFVVNTDIPLFSPKFQMSNYLYTGLETNGALDFASLPTNSELQDKEVISGVVKNKVKNRNNLPVFGAKSTCVKTL